MNRSTKTILGTIGIVALILVVNEVLQRPTENTPNPISAVPATTAGKNLLINGTFDKNVDSWQLNTRWAPVWSGAQGDGSVRVAAVSESGSTGRGVFNQCVNVSGNTRFGFGGSFKKDERSTQGGGGRLRVDWHEQEDCVGSGKTDAQSAKPEDVSGWQQLTAGVLTSPSDARSATVSIIQTVDGRGEFIAYWDDLYLNATE